MDNITLTGSTYHVLGEYEDPSGVIQGTFELPVENGASLVQGKVGLALSFNGVNQDIFIKENRDLCALNLLICDLGWSITFWIKLSTKYESIAEQMLFTSGGHSNASHGVAIWVKYGQIGIACSTLYKKWYSDNIYTITETDFFLLGLTWHTDYGMKLYINGKSVFTDHNWREFTPSNNIYNDAYYGRDSVIDQHYASIILDEAIVSEWELSASDIWQLYGKLHIDFIVTDTLPIINCIVQVTE